MEPKKCKHTYTITFGECAENHVGMQQLGKAGAAGLELADLVGAMKKFEAAGYACELVDLGELSSEPGLPAAYVLIVRGGVSGLLGGRPAAELEAEHGALDHDKKAFMYGRVVNKKARHNLCFADKGQMPDYEAGEGRVVAFNAVPLTSAIRATLPDYFGAKATKLYAEGNYYYNVAKCGIGFHGDAERRIVIAARLGAAMPLHFQWYRAGEPLGKRIKLVLEGGDLYAMSSKAVGSDWRKNTIATLRHAAGAAKYLQ